MAVEVAEGGQIHVDGFTINMLMEYKSNVKEREGLRLTPRFFGLSKWKNDVAIC